MAFLGRFVKQITNRNTEDLAPPNGTRRSFKTIKKTTALPISCDNIIGQLIPTERGILYLKQSKVSWPIESRPWKYLLEDKPLCPDLNESELVMYDLITDTTKTEIKIDTSDYKINLEESVYIKDPKASQLWLIHKNKELFTISIETKAKITKIIDIDTGNHWADEPKDPHNYACIGTYKGYVVILGAIPSTPMQKHSNFDRLKFIPFDIHKYRQGESHLLIEEFGNQAQFKSLTDNNCMLLMGGKYENTCCPTMEIYRVKIPNADDFEAKRWNGCALHLPIPLKSFGMIEMELKGMRYLILFGGTSHHNRGKNKQHDIKPGASFKGHIHQTDTVYALYLDDEWDKLSFDQKIDKRRNRERNRSNTEKLIHAAREQVEFYGDARHWQDRVLTPEFLHGLWLEVKYILPERAEYYAFYDKVIDKDTIHLITRDTFNHYTISYQELVRLLDKYAILKAENPNRHRKKAPLTVTRKGEISRKVCDGTCHKDWEWSEGPREYPEIKWTNKGCRRNLENEVIPFLCPPKYHYEYYKQILIKCEVNTKYPSFIFPIIFGYICLCDLDQMDQNNFGESNMAYQLNKVLNKKQTFLERTSFIPTEIGCKYEIGGCRVMIRNIESTLLLCECAEIINSLAYDVCNLNSWRRSFEKIWYWETDCTPMDPVVMTCFMIGELSAYLGKGKAVYVRIGICYRECGANTLEFTFSDCLDTFWSEAVDDYRFFNADQTKKFDPNWSF